MRFLPIAIATLLVPGMPCASDPPQAQETSSQLEAQAREAEAAGRAQEAFGLYVRAVQMLPKAAPDLTLREKIVTLSLNLDAPPPVPEQVERHSMRAQALIEAAATEDDLEAAAMELEQAVRAAPWLPSLAFNLALVRERQQYYRAAEDNLKLYLLSKPEDADEARRKLYALEIKRERELLSKEREACALEQHDDDPGTCAGLVLAAERIGYAEKFGAMDFACRTRERFCGALAAQILRAAAAERYPRNVVEEITQNAQALKTADIKADPSRVPDLIVTSCRKEPGFCATALVGVIRIAEVEKQAATEARDAEGLPLTGDTITDGVVAIASLFRRGPRTPWTDGFFARIGSKLSCPAHPADCLAAGYLAQDGLGRKADSGAAELMFENGCNGGVAAACDGFALVVGRTKPNVWTTNVPGVQVDFRVADNKALVVFKQGPALGGIYAVLRKSPKGYNGSYQAACGVRGTIDLQQIKRNTWQGAVSRVDCSVTPATHVATDFVLSRN